MPGTTCHDSANFELWFYHPEAGKVWTDTIVAETKIVKFWRRGYKAYRQLRSVNDFSVVNENFLILSLIGRPIRRRLCVQLSLTRAVWQNKFSHFCEFVVTLAQNWSRSRISLLICWQRNLENSIGVGRFSLRFLENKIFFFFTGFKNLIIGDIFVFFSCRC